jgi:hypothetical protein
VGSAGEDPVTIAMQAILAYLRAHPQAKDTAAGLVQWWLPPGARAARLWEVQEALERLVATGQMRAKTLPGGAVVYGDAGLDV